MNAQWMIYLAIGVGGAFGAMSRYYIQTNLAKWGSLDFPIGTLMVNIIGCLVAGILITLWQQSTVTVVVKSAVLVGFLGALTTFSAFSIDTLSLFQHQEWSKAGLNILLNLSLSLVAVFCGAWLGNKMV